MGKGKDVSALFAKAFARFDSNPQLVNQALESGYLKSGIPVGYQSEGKPSNVIEAPQYEMYPEKRAFEKVQKEQEQQKEFKKFLLSLSDMEMENLVELSRDRVIIAKSVLENLGKRGESLDTDRLEQNGLVKRSYLADDQIFEFTLTGKGREVLRHLGYTK